MLIMIGLHGFLSVISNDLINQWGTSAKYGSTTVQIVLPLAFSNTNYTILGLMGMASINAHDFINTIQVASIYETNFYMYKGASESCSVYWLTIGY